MIDKQFEDSFTATDYMINETYKLHSFSGRLHAIIEGNESGRQEAVQAGAEVAEF